MVDWTHVLVALIVGIPATITAIGGLILSWRNSQKIDDNTKLTKEGSEAAAASAESAAKAATTASVKTEQVIKQLNGGIGDVIRSYIEPLREEVKAHAEQDEKNMTEIRQRLDKLGK